MSFEEGCANEERGDVEGTYVGEGFDRNREKDGITTSATSRG